MISDSLLALRSILVAQIPKHRSSRTPLSLDSDNGLVTFTEYLSTAGAFEGRITIEKPGCSLCPISGKTTNGQPPSAVWLVFLSGALSQSKTASRNGGSIGKHLRWFKRRWHFDRQAPRKAPEIDTAKIATWPITGGWNRQFGPQA